MDLLRDRLQNVKKGNSTAEQYLAEIKGLADKLAAINHPVPESEIVTRMLNGLQNDPDYQPFVFAIENRELPPTFNDLRARLLVHEQRVQSLRLDKSSVIAPTGSQTTEVALVGRANTHPQRRDQRRDDRYSHDDHQSLSSNFAGLHLTPGDSFSDHVPTHWVADSGATSHMTSNTGLLQHPALQQPAPFTGNDQVYMGNGNSLSIKGVGN